MVRARCELSNNVSFKNSIRLKKMKDPKIPLLIMNPKYPNLIPLHKPNMHPKHIIMPLTLEGDLLCYPLLPPPVWNMEDSERHIFRASPFALCAWANLFGSKFIRSWTKVPLQEWHMLIQLQGQHLKLGNIFPFPSLLYPLSILIVGGPFY